MISPAQGLMIASATVAFAMGTGHLLLTFASRRFHPRDPQTEVLMRQDAPMLTRRTTIWNCWVGFNASHSMGPMLFGAVYGFLALEQAPLLFDSVYLRALGLLSLLAYLVLAIRYWFRLPLRGLLVVTACYVAALVFG